MIDEKIKKEINSISNAVKNIGNYKLIIQENSPAEKENYNTLLEQFISINSSSASNIKKGKVLEKLVYQLIKNTKLYDVYNNIKTSTNEIDVFFRTNDIANFLIKQGVLNNAPINFLGECKNYSDKIKVTYIGKFYSLMCVSKINYGIMFSAKGISGRGKWDAGNGLVKKIYMSKEQINDKIYILSFDLNDFKRINNGENFLDIISEKIESLRLDTSFEKYISTHSAESQI